MPVPDRACLAVSGQTVQRYNIRHRIPGEQARLMAPRPRWITDPRDARSTGPTGIVVAARESLLTPRRESAILCIAKFVLSAS